jgi:hypothetical protein
MGDLTDQLGTLVLMWLGVAAMLVLCVCGLGLGIGYLIWG